MLRNAVVCLVIFLFVDLVALSCGLEFPPPPLVKCHLKDEKCWIEQSQIYLKTYKNGIPELDIKPLDPMDIDDFEVKSSGNSATAFNLAMSNIKMFNLTGTKVTGVKSHFDDLTKPVKLQITLFSPHSSITAKYKIDGKILIFPIKGDGDGSLQITNTTVKINVILKFQKRDDGKSYFEDIDTKITSHSDDVKINLTNLFNGEKELADNVLKVMNDNWRLLSPDFDPQLYKSLGKLVNKSVKAILKDRAFEDIYLQD